MAHVWCKFRLISAVEILDLQKLGLNYLFALIVFFQCNLLDLDILVSGNHTAVWTYAYHTVPIILWTHGHVSRYIPIVPVPVNNNKYTTYYLINRRYCNISSMTNILVSDTLPQCLNNILLRSLIHSIKFGFAFQLS